MWKLTIALMFFLAALPSVAADYIFHRTVNGAPHGRYTQTVFVKGQRARIECTGGSWEVCEKRPTFYQCDLDRVLTPNDDGSYTEQPIRRQATVSASEVDPSASDYSDVLIEYRDTGQRKTIFGMQARLVTKEVFERNRGPKASEEMTTIGIASGWYVDLPINPECESPKSSGVSFLKSTTFVKYQERVETIGAELLGFPLELTVLSSRASTIETQLEVTSFEATELDSKLFEVPEEKIKKQNSIQSR